MRVGVAMSGGADSTAAALLLKQSGVDVVGLHMRLDPALGASETHARQSAGELRIPLYVEDLSRAFKNLVVDPFLNEYARGRTPSPCPICNRSIKTTLLYERAQSLGCHILATGHYARIENLSGRPALLKATDRTKDQSYFLFLLTREILGRTLLPLGGRTKSSVRNMLQTEGLSAFESDESQELCFIPDGDYKAFLKCRGLQPKPGPIVDLRGKILGTHPGVLHYTVGQRRGLGICGPRPHYVIKIDGRRNTLVVGMKEETFSSRVRISNVSILECTRIFSGSRCDVKIRSTARPVSCTLTGVYQNALELEFETPQSSVAPGQAAVLYDGDLVIGGGWIDETNLVAKD